MSEDVLDHTEEAAEAPLTDGEVVHWMDKRPIQVGVAGVSVVALSGFALGVAATLSALVLAGWIGPEREIEMRRFARRRA